MLLLSSDVMRTSTYASSFVGYYLHLVEVLWIIVVSATTSSYVERSFSNIVYRHKALSVADHGYDNAGRESILSSLQLTRDVHVEW